jgi:hypothetical protein
MALFEFSYINLTENIQFPESLKLKYIKENLAPKEAEYLDNIPRISASKQCAFFIFNSLSNKFGSGVFSTAVLAIPNTVDKFFR